MDTTNESPAAPAASPDGCCGCGGCARAEAARQDPGHLGAVADAVAGGVPATLSAGLDKRTADQRPQAFRDYCASRGDVDPSRVCMRDD